MSVVGLRIAGRRSGTWFALGFLPVVITALGAADVISRGPGQSDFWTFWIAGRTVLHGHDPYPAIASLPAVADKWFAPFVYPPVAAFAMAPLAVLPFAIAKVVFYAFNLGAAALALRLLGVRDWRCYGAAFASPPVIEAAGIGTISIPLLLLMAAAWRWRRHALRLGLVIACAVTAKLFLWPVWFWLVRTRRYAAAGIAVVVSLTAVVVSWAAIGFVGLRDYPQLLSRMTALEGPNGYSVYALERVLGVGDLSAARVGFALGLVGLAGVLRFVRGDRRTLAGLLGVAFVATPILWPHYLVLLFVPVAFLSRRFSAAWLVPVALWADATAWSHHEAWRIVGELVVWIVVVGAVVVPRWRRSSVAAHALPAAVISQPS